MRRQFLSTLTLFAVVTSAPAHAEYFPSLEQCLIAEDEAYKRYELLDRKADEAYAHLIQLNDVAHSAYLIVVKDVQGRAKAAYEHYGAVAQACEEIRTKNDAKEVEITKRKADPAQQEPSVKSVYDHAETLASHTSKSKVTTAIQKNALKEIQRQHNAMMGNVDSYAKFTGSSRGYRQQTDQSPVGVPDKSGHSAKSASLDDPSNPWSRQANPESEAYDPWTAEARHKAELSRIDEARRVAAETKEAAMRRADEAREAAQLRAAERQSNGGAIFGCARSSSTTDVPPVCR